MFPADHSPDKTQKELIRVIERYHGEEYITNRITQTMLNKSIVDTRIPFRDFLRKKGILNYTPIQRHRDHVTYPVIVMNETGVSRNHINFYAAETRGDARFSIGDMFYIFDAEDLVYITVWNQVLVFIKLDDYDCFESNLIQQFGS